MEFLVGVSARCMLVTASHFTWIMSRNCHVNSVERIIKQPAKTSISLHFTLLGTFCVEERLGLSDRNSILMTQINIYIKNPVVMGFQIYICLILHVFWSILVKCYVHLPTSSRKTQTLPPEKTMFHKYRLFCQRFFTFTFDLCGLLSVIRKQQLKQCNYSVNQSALLTGLRTDFMSLAWNFCR